MTRWEYHDRMIMFKESKEGLVSDLGWLKEEGSDGWELTASIPLIAPNRDGIAYGTVGALLIFKRPIG